MLYVLRLANGDSIVAMARNDGEARTLAGQLGRKAGEEVVSVRKLPQFCVRLAPADSGTLDVSCWDDATLDDLLNHEYPRLNDAIHSANRVRFLPSPDATRPLFDQLREAYEKNTDMIREGIRQERERMATPVQKAAVPKTAK
jgi:hypothetical protein